MMSPGVSFVVPVRNGAPWLREVIAAIWRQQDGRAIEVIAVDDGSDDGSDRVLHELTALGPLRVLAGSRRGAAAALNTGIRSAGFPLVCQVDQDVIIDDGWMRRLTARFDDPRVAAVQGYYASDRAAGLCARAMALDLEQRYDSLTSKRIDHVCTGNTAYRKDALLHVGLFDESLGYGYDNDISYRLCAAGYELLFCDEARSAHRWREGFAAYCVQQYGFGYGRLDLVAKHPRRATGDVVSPAFMMLHPIGAGASMVGLVLAGGLMLSGEPWLLPALLSAAVLTVLTAERTLSGIASWFRFRDAAALLFPVLHLARDLVWVGAILVWSARKLSGGQARPSNSMLPRSHPREDTVLGSRSEVEGRTLALIPAFNEASNLEAVVNELRTCSPALDILVIDDGSTDGTALLLPALGTQWLRFPERMGIGSAIRAGLRYASRMGYDCAVRLDGDGQHRAEEISRLLAPVRAGDADVVLGSRYITDPREADSRPERLVLRLLAKCLSALTGRAITDPTSGFCAFGPKAVRVLAEHHPTGYPEPELQLFLSRNKLRVIEVPVHARPRFAGRTSLTPARKITAGARVLLALIVEPFRAAVRTR